MAVIWLQITGRWILLTYFSRARITGGIFAAGDGESVFVVCFDVNLASAAMAFGWLVLSMMATHNLPRNPRRLRQLSDSRYALRCWGLRIFRFGSAIFFKNKYFFLSRVRVFLRVNFFFNFKNNLNLEWRWRERSKCCPTRTKFLICTQSQFLQMLLERQVDSTKSCFNELLFWRVTFVLISISVLLSKTVTDAPFEEDSNSLTARRRLNPDKVGPLASIGPR